LREALALWRDDVDRQARLFDATRTATAVRATLARGAPEDVRLPADVARRYIAAAVLLLGIGGSGALWLGPHPEQATLLSSGNALRLVERDRLQDSFDQPAWPLEPLPSPHADGRSADMTPRLRTIAILMLLAGLALGVFASRALRAIGPDDILTRPVHDSGPRIEALVGLYQNKYALDGKTTDRIRQELTRYNRRVGSLVWELRQANADRFRALFDDSAERIHGILSAAGVEPER